VIAITAGRDRNPTLASYERQDRVKRLAFGVICHSGNDLDGLSVLFTLCKPMKRKDLRDRARVSLWQRVCPS
jgi:hypothetical protein